MKTIQKTIKIEAPKEKVWNVLLEDEYNRMWFSEFSAGTYAETDWIEGHKISFIDDTKNGIFGKVEAKRPYDYISVVYEGEVKNGEEDTESEAANAIKGGKETYHLSEENGVTTLSIESDMHDKYFDAMSAAWDRALEKINELAIAI